MKPTEPPPATFRPGRRLKILNDAVYDPYQERGKLAEPSVCDDCGAVFHQGRWQWIAAPADASRSLCSACRRIQENLPAGCVSIEGPFAQSHHDELLRLARHLERREKAQHPLERIMAVDEEGGALVLTTTDIHLARTIGDALQNAYKGELDFYYNEDEYLLRVRWRR